MTECLHATLPADYHEALERLRALAPKIDKAFVTLVLPDFVGRYGLEHFEDSMDALKFFTPFGSSEFAIREFLRRDLKRTLGVMLQWSLDKDEHVRRLASGGCRPRLPWSYRLAAGKSTHRLDRPACAAHAHQVRPPGRASSDRSHSIKW